MNLLKKLLLILGFIVATSLRGNSEDGRLLGDIADATTTGDIDAAMTVVKSWWALHQGGFPQNQLRIPDATWRKPYTVPGLSVSAEWKAFCAWTPDRTAIWWAVFGARDRWTIWTNDSCVISWIIKVPPKSRTAELVEVRFRYPVQSEPAAYGGTPNHFPEPTPDTVH
jgi:hypothetical protein